MAHHCHIWAAKPPDSPSARVILKRSPEARTRAVINLAGIKKPSRLIASAPCPLYCPADA
jgi:hypothetical protein